MFTKITFNESYFNRLLRWVAIISGGFAIMISIMLIVNFLQVQNRDPLNTKAMQVLSEKWMQDPGNTELQEEIRQLDLLARKAFFTSQWQIKTGGYLLAGCLLLLVIALTSMEMLRPKIPVLMGETQGSPWERSTLQRKWIAALGMAVVLVAMVTGWMTHRSLQPALSARQEIPVMADSAPEAAPLAAPSPITSDSSDRPSDDMSLPAPAADGYPSPKEIEENFISFRGPGGNGVVKQSRVPLSWNGSTGQNICWKTAIPLPGYNSPILWKGKLFLSGAKDTRKEVYCLDASNGKILWTTDLSSLPGTPGQVPKVIAETGLAAPTMTTDGRRVYAIFANGDLAALDLEGKVIWSRNLGLPKNHYGHSSSLIMYRDLLLVQYDQSGSARVMALAGNSGETVWETTRNVKVSWASPVLVNTGTRYELILAAEPYVISYDPATGKELWRIDCISGEVGPSVAYANGRVFSVNDYSKVAAITIGDPPTLAWEDEEYLSDVPSPVASGDLLFVVTSYGAVVCYDAASGSKHWTREIDKSVYASPMIAGGHLFVLDKTGGMHIFKADADLSETGISPLGEPSSCTPVFGQGRIFIRGSKHLWCIGS